MAEPDQSPADLSLEDITRQANTFIERNEFERAYPYVCRLAERDDAAPQAGVAAGLMALTLNRKEEASGHFRRARDKSPEDFDASYNLALLDIAEGNFDEAINLLQALVQLHPDNAALHNDLAVVWMKLKDTPRAFQLLEEALRLDPDFAKARENAMELVLNGSFFDEGRALLQNNARHPQVSKASLADIKKCNNIIEQASRGIAHEVSEVRTSLSSTSCSNRIEGKKIAFFASQQTFVEDIIRRLSEENETRTFGGHSVQEMQNLMEWADIAWFEWCDSLIIEATKGPKRCRIVCRLHSYEAFTDMPARVDWGKVDRLIFVNTSVEKIFRRQVRADVPTAIIYNGVDIERFNIPTGKRYGKKIASVGYINYKKNPTLLLYCFKKIHTYDPGYSLHIAGQHQDSRIQVYFEHFLRENPLPVSFHGWVDDMPAWYADKDFVISTSLFESFHYSLAEGMASGLLPLIHDWYGAKSLYPHEFLFADPDDCLALLKHLESAERSNLAQENRQFIVKHYNQADKYEQIEELLGRVMEGSRQGGDTQRGIAV